MQVIVFERKTGRCLAGPNAPTAENLKVWLQKNPTFEVVRPGTLSSTKPLLPKKPSSEPNKIQTTLNFERIPRKPLSQPQPQTPTTSQQKPETKPLKTPVKETPKSPPPVKTVPKNIPVQKKTPDLAKPSTSKAPLELKRTSRTSLSLVKPRTSVEKVNSILKSVGIRF